MLEDAERLRYARQLLVPGFSESGQEKLKKSKVTIVGIGGLGCFSALSLAAAGVGNLRLIDYDIVEHSDLNRQVLYGEDDFRLRKVDVAAKRLAALNPFIKVTPVFDRLYETNAEQLLKGSDIVVDGTDNTPSRFALNSACVNLKIPLSYAGIGRLHGMATTVIPGRTVCLACFIPKDQEGIEEGNMSLGVIAPTPAVLANIQVLEVLKLILGLKPALLNQLCMFNGDNITIQSFPVNRNPDCKVCGGVVNRSRRYDF
jgi:molybdopterin-synthase adenylyltransferase